MIFRHTVLLQLLLLQCLCISPAVSNLYVGEGEDGDYVRVMVGFHDRKEEELYVRKQRRQPRTASGKPKTKILYEFQNTEAVVMEVSRAELEQMQKDPTFSYIEEDLEVPVAQRNDDDDVDDDDVFEYVSYGIEMTQADRTFTTDPTWDQQCGVYICVVDSGLYLNNTDVPYSRGDGYVDGDSFGPAAGEDWSYPIGTSHGTQVGGIMIASGGNDRGIVGVIPQGPEESNVCLRIAKVVPNGEGSTRVSTLLEASEWCGVQAGGKPLVINLSFAVGQKTNAEQFVYQRLYDQGALIVAAAGNMGDSRTTYPGAHDTVISVGSVDVDMEKAKFSVFNDDVELTAPGDRIFVLQAEGNQVQMTGGTSLSSPFVAGLAARIWTGVPRCSNVQVRQALRDTALRLGDGVPNPEYGYGVIQARDARDLLVNSGCNSGNFNPFPTRSPTPPPTPRAPTPPPTPTPPAPTLPTPPVPTPPAPTPPPVSGDEAVENNRSRFRGILQSRGPNFANNRDELRIRAEDWLIRDPQFNSYSDDRLIQRYVLTVFAYGMQKVSNPQALQNWAQYTGECSWFHTLGEDGSPILCDTDALYVRLDLRQQNLVGTLPSELALMSNHLRMIHLFDNLIYGELPTEIGLLANLERLELTQNSFNGELPPQIGNLAKLTFMGLGRNQFTGGLRTELGMLSRMNTMGLEINRFSGEIPSEMGNMSDLTILNMDRNRLAGTIPQTFGQLSNLKFMNLVFNDGLRGRMPDALCQFNMVNLGVDCSNVECPCCTSCHYYR